MNFIDALPSIVFSARLSTNNDIVFEGCNQRIAHYLPITPAELLRDANVLFNYIAATERETIKNHCITRLIRNKNFAVRLNSSMR